MTFIKPFSSIKGKKKEEKRDGSKKGDGSIFLDFSEKNLQPCPESPPNKKGIDERVFLIS